MKLKCRDHQFEIGKTYEHSGPLKMCAKGFHFHHEIKDIFNYYPRNTSRVCEVEAYDYVIGDDKAVCRRITIGKELSVFKILMGYGDGYGNGYGNGYGGHAA